MPYASRGVMFDPSIPIVRSLTSFPQGNESGTLSGILRDAGIDREELAELL
jgi:hypothetical protein